MKRHQELLTAAIAKEGEAQRALLADDRDAARVGFAEASELYRSSWKDAPPGSYGRLVGMLKAAVLAGGGDEEAHYVRGELGAGGADSPTASYAQALSALIRGEDRAAAQWSRHMEPGGAAFARTAQAIAALAVRDGSRYQAALAAIVAEFEQRSHHLTGVAVADTALMLQRLAARRGLAADVSSPLLPQA